MLAKQKLAHNLQQIPTICEAGVMIPIYFLSKLAVSTLLQERTRESIFYVGIFWVIGSLYHIFCCFLQPLKQCEKLPSHGGCVETSSGLDLTHGSGPCTRQSFEGRICVLVVWVFSEHTMSAPLMPVWLVSAGLIQLHWGLEWGYEFQTHFIHLLLLLLSHSVLSNSLWPHGLQHVRFPCPSPSPRACSKLYLSIWWCYLTISSSATLFSFCLVLPSIRVFCNESTVHIRWPKYWTFSFSSRPSNEYSELIAFQIDF